MSGVCCVAWCTNNLKNNEEFNRNILSEGADEESDSSPGSNVLLSNGKYLVTFHAFPANADLCKKWVLACQREDGWWPEQHSCICSDHFLPTDYSYSSPKVLNPCAIPFVKIMAATEENCIQHHDSLIYDADFHSYNDECSDKNIEIDMKSIEKVKANVVENVVPPPLKTNSEELTNSFDKVDGSYDYAKRKGTAQHHIQYPTHFFTQFEDCITQKLILCSEQLKKDLIGVYFVSKDSISSIKIKKMEDKISTVVTDFVAIVLQAFSENLLRLKSNVSQCNWPINENNELDYEAGHFINESMNFHDSFTKQHYQINFNEDNEDVDSNDEFTATNLRELPDDGATTQFPEVEAMTRLYDRVQQTMTELFGEKSLKGE